MTEQEILFKKAVSAVQAAGSLLTGPGTDLAVSEKGRTDFVTRVDTAVQARLQQELSALAPDFQFMGEEKDNREIDPSRALWILDPVDGTTNLIHGFRQSTISLALADGGQVFGGIVYQPFAGELFTAFRGRGAFLNGAPLQVSRAACLRDSLVSVGTNPGRRENADAAFARMRRIYDRCHDIRRVGAASLELCWVAAGRLDGYLEHGLKPWDYAAGGLILREAGGTITDFSGCPLPCGQAGDVVGTNSRIHKELITLL